MSVSFMTHRLVFPFNKEILQLFFLSQNWSLSVKAVNWLKPLRNLICWLKHIVDFFFSLSLLSLLGPINIMSDIVPMSNTDKGRRRSFTKSIVFENVIWLYLKWRVELFAALVCTMIIHNARPGNPTFNKVLKERYLSCHTAGSGLARAVLRIHGRFEWDIWWVGWIRKWKKKSRCAISYIIS